MNTLKLGDIQETALIPLAVRANETKGKARIHDEKAVEIIDALKINTKNFDKTATHECVVARTILFDKVAKEYIEKTPDAAVLNIGCGLDNRFSRVDNGKISWYNIDLVDAIDVRKKVYSESEREHMVATSILDENWTKKLPVSEDKKVIVIAEGLFMYFTPEQVSFILKSLTEGFKNGVLIVELIHKCMMKEKLHDTVKHTNAKFKYGIDKSAEEMLELNQKISFVKEISFSTQMKEDGFLSRLLGSMMGNLNDSLSVFEWQN